MRMSHNSLGALLLLGLPLLLGNKGCEADLHEADAEAVNEDDVDAATAEPGADGDDDAPPSSAPNPSRDGGSAPGKPAPVADGGAAPSKDAGVVPSRDAGGGTTAGRCGTRGGVTCAKDEFCQFAAN